MQQIYQQQMETHAKQTLASHGAAASGDLEEGLARMGLGSNVSKDHDSSASENSSGKDEKAGDERRRQRDHSGDEDDDEEDGVDDGRQRKECNKFINFTCIGLSVAVPSMWTRKDIAEFKDAIRREGGGDGVIRVGHGETVTVRVPTHPGGSALFWEFATDSYDLAFGVFFEWQRDEGETEVSVHVSDSEDEDLDEDFPGELGVDCTVCARSWRDVSAASLQMRTAIPRVAVPLPRPSWKRVRPRRLSCPFIAGTAIRR